MRYFITPNYCVPLNAKCGSSSLCRRIIATYYPEVEGRLQRAHYPPGLNADKIQPHRFVPDIETPDRPVAMLVREPLERFLSGVAYLNIDLDDAIDSLLNGTSVPASKRDVQGTVRVNTNVHFAKQSKMPYGETHLFRFPDHIPEIAALLGLGAIPELNVTPSPKPAATEAQRQAILDYYADDVVLYESITHPNTVVMAPVSPPDENAE
jgi:hypothetical protein